MDFINEDTIPSEKRELIRRDYGMVGCRLRRLFNIPSDEMFLDFEWIKEKGILRLTTLRDN